MLPLTTLLEDVLVGGVVCGGTSEVCEGVQGRMRGKGECVTESV